MEIQDYPNYLIYSDGKIWSKYLKGRFLKPSVNSCGYLHLRLCKDGKPKNMTIHRLIALHYIPNPENKEMVDHIDRDRQNNNINNLRWVTHGENQLNKDAYGAIKLRGVYKEGNRFRASIWLDSKQKHIGCYNTPQEASEARTKYINDNNIKIF